MIRSTQTWRHSERGAVAGLRLLGIGVLLLAVAVLAIYKFNPNKKPDSPTTTTTPSTTTTTTTTTTTEPPLLPDTLPLRCDDAKYALVAPFNGQQTDVLSDLRKTAETSGKQALIVSPRLCDVADAKRTNVGPTKLIFIGPFGSVPEACDFEKKMTAPRPFWAWMTTTTTQPPAPLGWKVHNIRNLRDDPQSCEGT